MRIATLAIILRDGKVLLGLKKTGEVGQGRLNGPGGKLEGSESPEECLIREVEEEVGLRLAPENLEKVSLVSFYVAGGVMFECYVYRVEKFEGEPQETADMLPEWHPVDALPLDKMHGGDKAWFERAVKGEKFNANVYYKGKGEDFEKVEFLPFV